MIYAAGSGGSQPPSGAVNLFSPGATLGAIRTNAFEGIRTRVNSEQGSVRGHGLI
jgi:hypothetical protein